MKLSEAKIKAAKPAEREYKLADGHGLTLIVMPHGSKLWRYRDYRNGKETMLSLGAYPVVTLAAARDRVLELRRQKHAATNGAAIMLPAPAMPAQELERSAHAAELATRTAGPTFKAFAQDWLDGYAKKQSISDAFRAEQQRYINHFARELGEGTLLASLTAPVLYKAAVKIAEERGDNAASRAVRTLQYVTGEAVLQGVIAADPAAAIKLSAPKAKARTAITDPTELGTLLRTIDTSEKLLPAYKLGLRLLSIVYTRPSELRLAKWSEFDLDAKEPQWIIPAERMKLRREHVVPLPKQAVAILRELHKLTGHTGTVLTLNGGKPLAAGAFRKALAQIGYKGKLDPHGFRATASTLLAEHGHDETVIELSLAHAIPGVKGIYNRSHKLPQRRKLAQAWADYLDKLAG